MVNTCRPFRERHSSDTRAATTSTQDDTLVDVDLPTGDAFLALSDGAASVLSSFHRFLLLGWILSLIIDERTFV